jgi:hypothetical protein
MKIKFNPDLDCQHLYCVTALSRGAGFGIFDRLCGAQAAPAIVKDG